MKPAFLKEKKKLDRLFIVGHLLTLLYVYLLGWWSLLMIPFAMIVFHIGHGAYAHRILCHNAAKISPIGHLIGNFCFNFVGWNSALVFGAIHTNHHRYAGTEKDPHEPRFYGKWNLLIGNYDYTPCKKFIKIKMKQPYVKWFHKNYHTIAWIGMPVFAPVFALGFWMRYVLNTLVHPKEEAPTSQNQNWLWPILLGDEQHELHHKRAYLDRHHSFDFVYLCIRFLKVL